MSAALRHLLERVTSVFSQTAEHLSKLCAHVGASREGSDNFENTPL